MDLGIRGRRAIINGGSAGLGFGTALVLAREGVDLFISARNADRLHAACNQIRDTTGAKVEAIVADHATAGGRVTILERCPEPDILIGTCSPPPYIEDFRSIADEDWRQNLELTLISPIEFMRAVVDGMASRRWGRIVNIATAAAKFPHPWRILSGAPRAALTNYSVAVARQVAHHNVTINTLLPAMHDTDGIRAIYGARAAANGTDTDTEIAEAVRSIPIPAGRFGSQADFGAIAAMFCSEQSNYITGQSLVVDGGVTNTLF
ncbi:SDR family oxidoreductase [Rhizorhabdus argentea]|uniref:SDR family oxidoreductase n=1 Tax=Rhizorhabdus argentea TaxID=1387174 RepID=UPI0030EF3615